MSPVANAEFQFFHVTLTFFRDIGVSFSVELKESTNI